MLKPIPNKISLVMVNLHGTLVNTPKIAFESYRQTLSESGISLTFDEYKQYIGTSSKTKMAQILADKHIDLNPAEVAALNKRKTVIYDSLLTKDVQIASVIEALKEFSKAQIKIVLVSNTSQERIQSVLKDAEISIKFDHILSDDFKPEAHTSVYESVASIMAMPLAQCVVIEDSKGIQEAARAGMYVVGVKSADCPLDLTGADLVIDHNNTSWFKDFMPKPYNFLQLFTVKNALLAGALIGLGTGLYIGTRDSRPTP